MKALLISNDSMVTKLLGATTKKLGLELVVQKDLDIEDLNLGDKFFLFVDEGVKGNFKNFKEKYKPISTCYLHKRSTPVVEGFENDIKKPFLPTEIFNLLKNKLADLGITEATTSNITRDELEDITQTSSKNLSKDLNLDEFEDFDLDSLDDLNIGDSDDEELKPQKILENSHQQDVEVPKNFEKDPNDLDLEEIFELKNFQEDLEPNTSPSSESDDVLSLDTKVPQETTQVQQDDDKIEKDTQSDNSFFDELGESSSTHAQELDFDVENTDSAKVFEKNVNVEENLENENLELSNNEFDTEQIQDEEEPTFASILDKEQIDEVKKLLESTQEETLEKPKENRELDLDNIDKYSMLEALKGIPSLESPKENPTNNLTTNALELENIASLTEQNLSLEKLQELLKSVSPEKLRSLLDGMEVTFHISFSKQKNEK